MPTVPRSTRQVGLAPLPGVRRTAAETALSTGAGVSLEQARTRETLGDVAGQFSRYTLAKAGELAEAERRRADEVALLEADNRLAQFEQGWLYDPEQGALTKKGKAALGLPEELADAYEQAASEIGRGLSTDRQRAAFYETQLKRRTALELTTQRHVFQQMQAYEAEELKAGVDNAVSSAIANARDPTRVGLELTRAVSAIRKHAPDLGLGPEQIAAQVGDVTSRVHVGVIDQLLATEQDRAAAVYYEEAKDQIKGEAIAKVERALEEGSRRAAAQKAADAIVAAGGTLTEQREKARAIDDAELRDQVMQRIEHEAAVQERADREADEARLQGAYDIVDQTRDVTKIPPGVWTQLSGNARSALRSYTEHLTRGVPVQTDLPTYYGLMRQAAEKPDDFAVRNLLEFKGKLDEVEFKQLATLQLSIRNADNKKADAVLDGFRTNNQLIDDSLTLFGVDPNAKPNTDEGKAIAQLRRMLDRRVQAQGTLTGKKPTNADIQLMLDELLATSVEVPGSFWQILPGGLAPGQRRPLGLLQVTVGDIAAADRKLAEEALKKAGRPVTDATILDLYLETQARLKGGR